RLSYQPAATKFYRAYGFVNAWRPLLVNGMTPRVQIQTADVLDRLSRLTMQHLLIEETAQDNLTGFWPMFDPAPYQTFTSRTALPALVLGADATACAITAGASSTQMIFPDGWTGAVASAFGAGIGPLNLTAPLPPLSFNACTVEGWVSLIGGTPTNEVIAEIGVQNPAGTGLHGDRVAVIRCLSDSTGFQFQIWASGNNVNGVTFPDDGKPHHVALSSDSTGLIWSGYFDGQLACTLTVGSAPGTVTGAQFLAQATWTATGGTVT